MLDILIIPLDIVLKADMDWLEGKACLMVVFLMDKYEERGTITAIKARNELVSVIMGKREHPDHLFDKLLVVKVKFGRIANSGNNDEVSMA